MSKIVRTCKTQCENVARSVLTNFLIILSDFNVISKKKGHHADGGIFFSDFMLISKKSPLSEFSKFSTRFMQHTEARRCVPQLSMFFAGEKNAGICKNSVQKSQKKLEVFPAPSRFWTSNRWCTGLRFSH